METEQVTLKDYIWGFLVSLLLTLSAYLLVVKRLFAGKILAFIIISLGLIQMIAQLRYFFHLGHESKPRFNLLMFLFMALILVVVVFGSLWIMYSLKHYDMR